ICLSKRPGRKSALSNTSARLVDAKTIIPSLVAIPSISTTSAKRSRTLAAPKPPIISINSEPFIDKNGTFASVATAFASIVLPHPGGPSTSFKPATSTNLTPFPPPVNGSTR
ncbi:GSCOCG00009294001-RA-CDS, partial [Cotesia congregata]